MPFDIVSSLEQTTTAPPFEMLKDREDQEGERVVRRQQESPQEREERQYRERLEQLTREAYVWARMERIRQTLRPSSSSTQEAQEQRVLRPTPKVHEGRLRTFLAQTKDGVRLAFFRWKRVPKPEQLLHLVGYLETTVEDRHERYVSVSKERAEAAQQEYEARGYHVWSSYEDWNDRSKQRLKLCWRTPYHFDRSQTKTLSRLVGQPNDPIEVIELMKQVGFEVDGDIVRDHINDLALFVSSPEIARVLRQMAERDINGLFGFQYHRKHESEWEREKPDVAQEFQKIAQDKDGHAIEDLSAVLHCGEPIYISMDRVLRNMRVWREEGLMELLRERLSQGFDPALWKLDRCLNVEEESIARSSAQELRSRLNDPTIIGWIAEKPFFEFSLTVAAIMGLRLHPDDIPRYRELHHIPTALPTLMALRNDGYNFPASNVRKFYEFNRLVSSLKDQEFVNVITDNDFASFVKELQDAFGYVLRLYDIKEQYTAGDLWKLYERREDLAPLMSDQGKAVVACFSEFRPHDVPLYLELAAVPRCRELIDRLCAFSKGSLRWLRDEHERKSFIALGNDEQKQSVLFAPQTVALIHWFEDAFAYEFQLSHVDSIVSITQSPELMKQLRDPAMVTFLATTRTFRPHTVLYLVSLEPELRGLLQQLGETYHYSPFVWKSPEKDRATMEDESQLRALLADRTMQQRLTDPSRVTTVNQFLENHGGRFDLRDIDRYLALTPSSAAFVERLKESGLLRDSGYDVTTALEAVVLEPYEQSLAELPQGITLRRGDPTILAQLYAHDPLFFSHLHAAAGYEFRLFDLSSLLPLAEQSILLCSLLGRLRSEGITATFSAKDASAWAQLSAAAQDELIEKLKLLSRHQPRPFDPTMVHQYVAAITMNLQEEDFPRIQAAVQEFREDPHHPPEYLPALGAWISLTRDPRLLDIARVIKQKGVAFVITDQVEKLRAINNGNLLPLIEHCALPSEVSIIMRHADQFAAMEQGKRMPMVEVLVRLDESPSQEIQRLRDPLIKELLAVQNPVAAYENIERIFVKNNLPIVGKIYRVFEQLYPEERLNSTLTNEHLSPVLRSSGARRRTMIIYRDLLNIHLHSGNRNLRDYLLFLQEGEESITKLDQHGEEALSGRERDQLMYVLDKLQTLYERSLLGRRQGGNLVLEYPDSLSARVQELRRALGVGSHQRVSERIAEMFLKPAGVENINAALRTMEDARVRAHERNVSLANGSLDGRLELRSGDYLKGVDETYIAQILQNGSVAREYLGAAAGSDSTPLDTDLSKVLPGDIEKGFRGAFDASIAPAYGNLSFVVRDRGQLHNTDATLNAPQAEQDKWEIFPTMVLGERHYGIRTGFPTTEIDFIIAKPNLFNNERARDNLYYEIAQNGYYIPVTDVDGTIVFTPEMYEQYRRVFNGLEYFNGGLLDIQTTRPEDPQYEDVRTLMGERQALDAARIEGIAAEIRLRVLDALEDHGIALKSEFDTGIIGAELFDIGSTGRHTNTTGDIDFDLTLRLDAKDFEKVPSIVRELMAIFKPTRDSSHTETDYYQLRAIGATGITAHPIDIDIGFVKKSTLIPFASHDAVEQRLNWILRNRGEEVYQEVLADIIVAKKVLKDGRAYKKLEDGGMGGIGVENWILQHGGNFVRAFETFRASAYRNGERIPLEQFKGTYRVLDAGVNVKNGFHDDFVHTITPEGYHRLLDTIEQYQRDHASAARV